MLQGNHLTVLDNENVAAVINGDATKDAKIFMNGVRGR